MSTEPLRRLQSVCRRLRLRATRRPGRAAAFAFGLLWAGLAWLMPGAAHAEGSPPAVEISGFEIVHSEEGVQLSFATRFELPRSVEEALQKGVPLHFVAEAAVFRDRWYWFDRRVTTASRSWRLAYQPLTRKYRVSFGALNQNFDSLADALAALRRTSDWKIAETTQIEDGVRHYVEFKYRLDTTQLPRPMQIGIGGQADWALSVEHFQRF